MHTLLIKQNLELNLIHVLMFPLTKESVQAKLLHLHIIYTNFCSVILPLLSTKEVFLCSSVLQPAPNMQLKAMHNREDSDSLFSNGLSKEQQNH